MKKNYFAPETTDLHMMPQTIICSSPTDSYYEGNLGTMGQESGTW